MNVTDQLITNIECEQLMSSYGFGHILGGIGKQVYGDGVDVSKIS